MPLVKSSKKSNKKSAKKSKKSNKKSTKKPKINKKEIKTNPKDTKEKLSFDEWRELQKREKQNKIKQEEDNKNLKLKKAKDEELLIKRYEKVITPYIKKLEKKIKENDTEYFAWGDDLKKKIYKERYDIEKLILKDFNKYKGKHLFQIGVSFTYDMRNTNKGAGFIYKDTWLYLKMQMYKISDEPTLDQMYTGACVLAWYTKDFAITKFSYKFIEFIAENLIKQDLLCQSISGVPIHIFITKLKDKNIKIPKDLLKPLPGLK
ncbi:MAG: hypothetical protein ACRCZI_12495 [Cetobacterium sp.]